MMLKMNLLFGMIGLMKDNKFIITSYVRPYLVKVYYNIEIDTYKI